MATSAQPESGREAPDASAAAAREASTPNTPKEAVTVPGTPAGVPAAPVPARNEGETGDQYKARIQSEARTRALALAEKAGLPGVGAPPLSEKEVKAGIADIHNPVQAEIKKAAEKAAAAAGDAPAEGEIPDGEDAAVTVEGAEAEPAVEAAPETGTEQQPETDAASTGVVVEIAVPGQESPFQLEVGDDATAEIIRGVVERAKRADRAHAIREEATLIRDRTEDDRDRFQMVVDLDPAGVIQESVTDVRDQAHLTKFMITRPGILQNPEIRQFIADALEDSAEDAQKRAELVELERYKRRDAVKDAVHSEMTARRDGRQERRSVAAGIHSAIESLAPESFTKDSLDALYEDVATDVEAVRANSPSKKIDGRNIPAIVARRLKLYGHAPRGTTGSGGPAAPTPIASSTPRPSAPAAAKPVATVPPVKPVAPNTAKALREAALKRQEASTAGPGQGGQVSRTPTAPAFDPKQKGNALEQRIAWARKVLVPSMSKKPV